MIHIRIHISHIRMHVDIYIYYYYICVLHECIVHSHSKGENPTCNLTSSYTKFNTEGYNYITTVAKH